jgi:hypothetical protein
MRWNWLQLPKKTVISWMKQVIADHLPPSPAGKYLDDPAVQQNASTVLDIASANKDFSGDITRTCSPKPWVF